jgi:hypothetical protein
MSELVHLDLSQAEARAVRGVLVGVLGAVGSAGRNPYASDELSGAHLPLLAVANRLGKLLGEPPLPMGAKEQTPARS